MEVVQRFHQIYDRCNQLLGSWYSTSSGTFLGSKVRAVWTLVFNLRKWKSINSVLEVEGTLLLAPTWRSGSIRVDAAQPICIFISPQVQYVGSFLGEVIMWAASGHNLCWSGNTSSPEWPENHGLFTSVSNLQNQTFSVKYREEILGIWYKFQIPYALSCVRRPTLLAKHRIIVHFPGGRAGFTYWLSIVVGTWRLFLHSDPSLSPVLSYYLSAVLDVVPGSRALNHGSLARLVLLALQWLLCAAQQGNCWIALLWPGNGSQWVWGTCLDSSRWVMANRLSWQSIVHYCLLLWFSCRQFGPFSLH